MHVIHLIAVEADGEEDAITEAESMLSGYGDGNVWDWYTVGGRWDGILAGKNVLRFTEDKHAFIEAVNHAIAARNEEFRRLRDDLKGTKVTADDLDDVGPFGLGYDDKVAAAKRISDSNKTTRQSFNKLLNCETIEEYKAAQVKGNHSHWMLGYYLRKMGELVSEQYCFNSMFYDAVYGSAGADELWARLEKDPERQWLVAVDLHN